MLIKINIAYSLQNSLILVNQLYEVLFHFFHFLRCFEKLVVLTVAKVEITIKNRKRKIQKMGRALHLSESMRSKGYSGFGRFLADTR